MRYGLKFLMIVSIFFLCIQNIFAKSEVFFSNDALQDIDIRLPEVAYIGDEFSVDVGDISQSIADIFPEEQLSYEWDIFGEAPQDGETFSIQFQTAGRKQISLNIYTQERSLNSIEGGVSENQIQEKSLIYSTSFFPFIYEKSIALKTSKNVDREILQAFISTAEDLGIYVYTIDDDQRGFQESITQYSDELENTSDYVVLWGDKDFMFSYLSQIQATNTSPTGYNFVLISPFNNLLIEKYIENNIAGKSALKNGIIIDESLRLQSLKHPDSFSELRTQLDVGNHQYIELMRDTVISPWLFMSQFVKELSNDGVSNADIYILLLLPIFLTLIAIFKHIIGLSPLGNIIPVFLGILFIRLDIMFIVTVFSFLVILNISLSHILNKYTLLYTPKIVCITLINIILFMLLYQGLQYFDMVRFSIENILYVILFFIISEKMISIINTKEFREYKKSLWSTLLIALLLASLYYIDSLLVFLIAYPEILLILIPFNFFLGRFTGLRMTEYFRFRDTFKNIEE